MTVSAITALFAFVLLAATAPQARADNWCRLAPDSMRACGFASKQMCLDMTSGRGGMCDPNPFEAKANRAYAYQPAPAKTKGAK